MTVVNMSIKFIFFLKGSSGIYLVFHPISKRIVKQWSPFDNGDELFLHKEIDDIVRDLMNRGWEIKGAGEYD